MLSAARAIACDDAADDGRRQLFNRKNAGRGVAMALRLRDWVSIWFRDSVSCDFTQPPLSIFLGPPPPAPSSSASPSNFRLLFREDVKNSTKSQAPPAWGRPRPPLHLSRGIF